MKSFHPQSVAEQVAQHLRAEIQKRHLRGEIPGIHQLAAELAVNHKTVKAALELLQKEGLLVSQGLGKPRRISLDDKRKPPGMRIAVLLYEPADRELSFMLRLQSQLQDAGHQFFIAEKTLTELNMNVRRVAGLVKKTKADAWIIVAGSRDVLNWFANQDFPAFALFGRSVEVDMAATAPEKMPALTSAVRHLVQLGHQRIVMLAREERRHPQPGFLERGFLNELEANGITTGSYNLPDWEESPGRLQSSLDTLFRYTPPTALFIQSTELALAVLQYAGIRGIRIPEDLSIVCMDPSPAYAWCHPQIYHIAFDSEPWIRRITQWTRNVARGKDDRRRALYPAKFIEGGTIGACPTK